MDNYGRECGETSDLERRLAEEPHGTGSDVIPGSSTRRRRLPQQDDSDCAQFSVYDQYRNAPVRRPLRQVETPLRPVYVPPPVAPRPKRVPPPIAPKPKRVPPPIAPKPKRFPPPVPPKPQFNKKPPTTQFNVTPPVPPKPQNLRRRVEFDRSAKDCQAQEAFFPSVEDHIYDAPPNEPCGPGAVPLSIDAPTRPRRQQTMNIRQCDSCSKDYLAIAEGEVNINRLPAGCAARICDVCKVYTRYPTSFPDSRPVGAAECPAAVANPMPSAPVRVPSSSNVIIDERFYDRRLGRLPAVHDSEEDLMRKLNEATDMLADLADF